MQPNVAQQVLALFAPGNDFIYLAACFLGLYFHYLVAKKNGRTAAVSFVDYWVVETPGLSIATLLTLATAAGAILKSGVLGSMDAYSIFLMGFGKAYLFDSLIQAPPAAAPAKPAGSQAGFARVEVLAVLLLLAATALTLTSCATVEAMFGSTERILKQPPAQCVTVTKNPDGKEVRSVNQLCFDAAEAIAQANALLAAVDRATLNNLQAGIWTKAQAQPYYDQTSKLGERVEQANTVFLSNNFTQALTSANATKQIILQLQKQVAAQARK